MRPLYCRGGSESNGGSTMVWELWTSIAPARKMEVSGTVLAVDQCVPLACVSKFVLCLHVLYPK